MLNHEKLVVPKLDEVEEPHKKGRLYVVMPLLPILSDSKTYIWFRLGMNIMGVSLLKRW